MKKILTVSLVAMMAVSAARAEIASKAYVDQQDGQLSQLTTTAKTNLVAAINEVDADVATLNLTDPEAQGYANSVAGKIAAALEGANASTALQPGDNVSELLNDANYLVKNNDITGATKTKITYDAKGLVTAGADLEATDIPAIPLSKISDVTATAAEVNVLDGITASTDELNILDGVTATTAELNYVDGVTSSIQNQLDGKQATIDATHQLDSAFIDATNYSGSELETAVSSQISSAATTAGTLTTSNYSTTLDPVYVNANEVTSTYAADGTAPVTGTAVKSAIDGLNLGTMATETAANYTKTADLDSSATATTKEVVTGVTMADGVITVSSADPLTNAAYSLQAAGGEAGKYALTAVYDGNTLTGYSWELIQRATAQQGGGNNGQ